MWRQQHVVGHHVYTNVEGRDPDIRVSEKDVRRVTPRQPRHPWHAAQHLYLGLLYGLLAIKSIYVDDFAALATGSIGPQPLARMTRPEAATFAAGKAFYAAYMLVAPAVWSHRSWGSLAALWLLCDAVTGWLLAFMFQVAHVVDGVDFPQADAGTGRLPRGWAASQLATTADFAPGSWFWTHFSGGLNYQSVHHLFPGVCHCHYPAIAPIVARTAREFGHAYNVFPTFASALKAHFSHLRTTGLRAVPRLG